MFWDNLSVPSFEVKLAKKILYIPWQKTEIMQLISVGDCPRLVYTSCAVL
jgi:hypothetical protein